MRTLSLFMTSDSITGATLDANSIGFTKGLRAGIEATSHRNSSRDCDKKATAMSEKGGVYVVRAVLATSEATS